jgi:hypothetical protein
MMMMMTIIIILLAVAVAVKVLTYIREVPGSNLISEYLYYELKSSVLLT